MKIIISHDIDHLSVYEHKLDSVVPKFLVRSAIEVGCGSIGLSTLARRVGDICLNRWNNIDELLEFDKAHGVKSTFFFGMAQGLGMVYKQEQAVYWIKKAMAMGFDVGVHGVEYKDRDLMREEYEGFKRHSGLEAFGIRMHYLRADEDTLAKLADIGYIFDTTEYSHDLKQPYRIGNMAEFPLHIMDGHLFYGDARFQKYGFSHAADMTKRAIETAAQRGGIFNVLFHQRYFSDSWPDWKKWYIWLVKYCEDNSVEFTSYREELGSL